MAPGPACAWPARSAVVLSRVRGGREAQDGRSGPVWDIGRELYVAHNTVHSHVRSIYRQRGCCWRGEAPEPEISWPSARFT